MPLRFVSVLAFAVTSIACGHNASPIAPTPPPSGSVSPAFVTVSGRVIDYTTNVAASGLRLDWVAVKADFTSERRTVVTDSAGNYVVELPPADRNYQLSFPTGTNSSAAVIVPAKTYRTDFFINPGACVLGYGFIFDAVTRAPVPGAEVLWVDRAVTAADGSYRIEPGCGRSYGGGTSAFRVVHPRYTTFSGISTRREFLVNGGIYRRDEFLTPISAPTQSKRNP